MPALPFVLGICGGAGPYSLTPREVKSQVGWTFSLSSEHFLCLGSFDLGGGGGKAGIMGHPVETRGCRLRRASS